MTPHVSFIISLILVLDLIGKVAGGDIYSMTEVHESYPELNGGQIRRARGLSVRNR